MRTENLYVHFPFCRRKCAYCALRSRAGSTAAQRAGSTAAQRAAHVRRACAEIRAAGAEAARTVYFGGGTPALCDLSPFAGLFARAEEFTVELHPLDVTDAALDALRAIGANRISLGVQSFHDATLAAMGRLHDADTAARAFARIRAAGFGNAGLDLIAGWPGDTHVLESVRRAIDLGAEHVSLYSLIVEPHTPLARDVRRGAAAPPPDDAVLDTLRAAADALARAGLRRYEISNYARPGRECRHNLAVWRGEDYLGVGPGAYARAGRARWHVGARWARAGLQELSPGADARERALFALRLAEGLDLADAARRWPAFAPLGPVWRARLAALVAPGLVTELSPARFALTARGFEVCDAVLAELV